MATCEFGSIATSDVSTLRDRFAAAGVVQAIGNTPLVRLHRFTSVCHLPGNISILLKTEWVNPGGSVKDRPARAIVEEAIATGQLVPGQTLLDATSGNTGIAYAMLGAAIGFPVELVTPASASEERKRTLAAFGAKLVYSDPYDGSNGAIKRAREIATTDPRCYFYADQYSNSANTAAHFRTTGPELWTQTRGGLTHFVAGLGTTGTLMGTGAFLKLQNPGVILAAVQPAESFHGIEGLKHLPSAIVPAIYDARLPDRHISVETEEAYRLARELVQTEGLFAGTSTGAALAGALFIARECAERNEAAMIVAIAPDGGGKYLSTGLWM